MISTVARELTFSPAVHKISFASSSSPSVAVFLMAAILIGVRWNLNAVLIYIPHG